MAKIKIILGTTRPERFGVQPAEWLLGLANEHGGAEFELIDLKEVNLPLFEEPLPPAMGAEPTSGAAQKWAQIVGEADGYIIVTGEYDHTIPAALSNAIQYLAKEWTFKPVGYVSYGVEGGVRAVEHLRAMAGQLNQFDLSSHVAIPNYWAQLDEKGTWTASEAQVKAAGHLLDDIVRWTDVFKAARES